MATEKEEMGIGALEDLILGQPKYSSSEIESLESMSLKEDETKVGDTIVNDDESSLKDLKKELERIPDNAGDITDLGSEKPEELVVIGKNSNIYRDILKSLFGDEISTVVMTDEDGNDVDMSLDELDIDKELFDSISKQAIGSIKESEGKNKISVEGVSELALQLIEIDKKGGKISDLTKLRDNIIHPLDGLDLTKREDQIKAVFIRQRASGIPDEDTEILVRGYLSNGVLEEKAVLAEGQLREYVDKQIEARKLDTENKLAIAQENQKQFKKLFRDNLKGFDLNKTYEDKLVRFAFEEDPNTRLKEMDMVYAEMRNNPATAHKLALFLRNMDEYDKFVSAQKVKEVHLDSARKIKVVRSGAGTGLGDRAKEKASIGSLEDLKI